MSASYPPEPWTLRARAALSTFLVPRAELPARDWPAGHRPVTVAGRVPLGAAWVVYEPGGVLQYRELLVAVLLRRGHRVRPHVIEIWVDSAASCAGGRALWGIPKGMASFSDDPRRPACRPEGEAVPVASAAIRTGPGLAVRVPAGFSVVQHWPLPSEEPDGPAESAELAATPGAGAAPQVRVSPVRTRSRLGAASLTWSFDPQGALGVLAGRRPTSSLVLRDVTMLFGMTARERALDRTSSQV